MADQDGSRWGTLVQAQRVRTVRIQPEAELPLPPPQPGPELDFPLEVSRQPRAGILLNDVRADYLLLEMDVTNNRFFEADRFRCELAYVEDDEKFGRAFWDTASRIDIEFFAGFGVDEPPSTSLLSGRVDEVQIDLENRTVSLSGRDYTADLIETRLAEKYPNKKSSEIAVILAGMAGLTPEVTETSRLAGTYYRAEHAQLADETTAWTLLTYLAEREGFDAYVMGRKLYFGPPPDPITASRWTLNYQSPHEAAAMPFAPVMRLRLTKSLTVSRDIAVNVISWNSARKHSLTGTSRSRLPTRGASGRFQSAVAYVFRVPNLTQDQADALARQLALTITKDLRSFEVDMPGETEPDIRTVVTIKGTGTTFDTEYHLDEITRRMSQGTGFTMHLRGRNVTPDDGAGGTAAL